MKDRKNPHERQILTASLENINQDIVACTACPRLLTYCQGVAKTKKRAYLQETYWGKPVPGFGDPSAKLWIVGLAPAAHGANRTGRMFTGDSSGDWLYRALFKVGFANQPHSTNKKDGLLLKSAYISAAGRCAPPDNKPSLEELERCSSFLDRDFKALTEVKAILALGQIAFKSVLGVLERAGIEIQRPRPAFIHGGVFHVENLSLFTSYHPSRQNTNTGRLTLPMWISVFKKVRLELELQNDAVRKGNLVAAHGLH